MYGWLWRHLPGPTGARVIQALLIATLVLAGCVHWVFPALADTFVAPDPSL